MKNEYLGFGDSTGGQNYKNSTMTLNAPKTKNIIIDNDNKFKKIFTGVLGVNCDSFIMTTPNTRSFQAGLILANARKNILDNLNADKIFDELLNDVNLTIKYVKDSLKEKKDLIEKKLLKKLIKKLMTKQCLMMISLKTVKITLNG